MDERALHALLRSIQDGSITVDQAAQRLRRLPFEDLDFAKIDHHRNLRCGFPEVVYCEGKSPDQVVQILASLVEHNTNVLATRASVIQFESVSARFPAAQYHQAARTITIRQRDAQPSKSVIPVLSAGTCDGCVAEEARITAEIMDQRVQTYYDVGVAGLHRLLVHAEALQSANVCVVVAGMEGALPSVVGGLVSCPVIAVPTSVGYGASFGGVSALLTMLNSCASGVTVVNIDNGFSAGYTAALINRMADRE